MSVGKAKDMRRHQQRIILELLETIKEAQTEGYYADCQSGAISVGEFIEEIEGEGTETVAMLEEYCDLLFLASNGEVDGNKLAEQFKRIEDSVVSELKPSKIEVVFFPYMLSMWDSLESIYLAAKEDPGCDAYVVPIPYYDKNPDGTVGEMHYDGDQYPDSIQITDWQTYDMEARHPDAAFTFNPYDEGNVVTSVHPAFYCKRLRNFTDMLIYVPYYVVAGEIEEDFCILAGCIHAHKVILQSEEVREAYVKEFKKAYGNKFGNPEDKFVALGSPKLDKVRNSKRGDFELPAKWKSLIGHKKAILYNTTIGAVIDGEEKYIEKLRNVINEFKNRDDVALWWRPHPLIEATISKMLPNLLGEYKQIVNDYKQEGWGIYDDTADLHRAISWTDAYYGDLSSLVTLYEATGKPIMLQDVSGSQPESNGYKHYLLDTEIGNGNLICFSVYDGVISSLSLIDTCSLIRDPYCSYPIYDSRFFPLPYSYVVARIGKKMYFVPRWYVNGDHIAIYDENTKQFEFIKLDDKQDSLLDDEENKEFKKLGGALVYSNSPKFQKIIHHKESLFIVPSSYPAIVKLDLNTDEVTYFDEYIDEVLELTALYGTRGASAFSVAVQKDEKIVLCCRWTDLVVEFDMDSCKSEVIMISERGYGSQQMLFDGIDFWMFSQSRAEITSWNPESKKTLVLRDFPKEVTEIPQWQSLTVYDGFIYASLANCNKVPIKVDVKSGDITAASMQATLISVDDNIVTFLSKDSKLFFTTNKGNIFEISSVDTKTRKSSISASLQENMQNRNKLFKFIDEINISTKYEGSYIDLNAYIESIADEDTYAICKNEGHLDTGEQVIMHVKAWLDIKAGSAS